MAHSYQVVGLGELLWDLFPQGKQLGGAPANFAYITSLLGDRGIPASCLGMDDLGAEAMRRLTKLGLETNFIQSDAAHPTGTVLVEVDEAGQPCFKISDFVAWDFLQWTPQWEDLATQTDAVCFGSLAQRSPQSHATIRSFVNATRSDTVRIFDVNLRQHFFSAQILADSMKLATILKLNHEELPRIMQLLGSGKNSSHNSSGEDEEASCRCLLEIYQSKLICLTRGNHGSLLVTAETSCAHPGFKVKIADTVGSGDAFTAALVHEYLRGSSLQQMNETANRMGAWVATQAGAMPVLPPGGLEKTLAGIG
jgi:fructokinase